MADWQKVVASAGVDATTPVLVELEPGLPFLGELLHPRLNYRVLNKLRYWTIRDVTMQPRFPVGTVLATKLVRRRRDLLPGVYIYRRFICDQSVVVFGRLDSVKRGLIGLSEDNPKDGDNLKACLLAWGSKQKPGREIEVWRVTHYVSIGNGTYTPAKEKRQRRLTLRVFKAEQRQELFFKGHCEITVHHPRLENITTMLSPGAMLIVHSVIGKQLDNNAVALRHKLDEVFQKRLLAEARQLVKKGGASL